MTINQQMLDNKQEVHTDATTKPGNGLLLALLLTGMFVNLLNVSIINVMLPTLMSQFTLSATTAQWLSTGFLLTTGIMITAFSWRVLFWVMAIIGAVVAIAAVFGFTYRNPVSRTRPDAVGIVLIAVGLSALLYGASTAGKNGWGDPTVLTSLIGGAISLTVFAVFELHSDHPLLDLRVFADRVFSKTVAITMILQMAFYGGLILMPLYFQNVQGFSSLKTGLLLLPGSVLIGVVGIFTGKLYDKIGIKPLAITGALIMAIAAVFLARLTPGTGYGYSLATYTVFALGVAIVTTPITTAAFATINPTRHADASTLQNMVRQIAGAIGTAVLISTMSTAATSYAAAGHTPVLAAAHGINTAFILTIVLCLITAAASLFLTSTKEPGRVL